MLRQTLIHVSRPTDFTVMQRLDFFFFRTGPFMKMQKALREKTCPRRSRLKEEGERGGKMAVIWEQFQYKACLSFPS